MSSKPYRSILLFGPPGSGKGTQGKILGQVPAFRFVSMGEVLRAIPQDSELGRDIYQYLDRGDLAPARLVLGALDNYLERLEQPLREGPEIRWILDGVPRNAEQAELLASEVVVEKILHLDCESEFVLQERLRRRSSASGRTDDANDEVIRHRFEVYRQQTEPLLEMFPAELIAEIDAAATPLMVLKQIVNALA